MKAFKCWPLTWRLPSSLCICPLLSSLAASELKLHPLVYSRACVAPRLWLLLRYCVEVMPRHSLRGLQLLPQLPRLLLGLSRSLAGVPQGALGLAHALLQLPVSPLYGVQALLQLATSFLLLEQRRLDRGAHELGEDRTARCHFTRTARYRELPVSKTLQLVGEMLIWFSQQPLWEKESFDISFASVNPCTLGGRIEK